MGLDQYITRQVIETEDNTHPFYTTDGRVKPIKKINVLQDNDFMYFRKFNHLHGWFEETFKMEIDNVEPVYFGLKKLFKLREDSQKVLDEFERNSKRYKQVAEELFPSRYGLFFGSDEYGEYFRDNLNYIVDHINEEEDFLLNNDDIVFRYKYLAWW
jgi:Asp-tRNA(Asn)/Glu-tRNA(Gln) amidotransferase C subunit